MSSQGDAFARHQQARWMKPDAARWVRPDAARFVRPGACVADVFPASALKYNRDQPRVPPGNGEESGRWTSGGSGSGRPRVYIRTSRQEDAPGDGADTGAELAGANPLGAIDFGEIGAELQSLNLFGTVTRELLRGLFRLAGDLPRGIGDNGGPPLDEPPEIPAARPRKSWQVTEFLRSAANWIVRALRFSAPVVAFQRSLDEIEWLQERRAEIETVRDAPKDLEDLHRAVSVPRGGTQVHHIAEQTAMERWGFSKRDINARENLVRIPTLKHYDITRWYGQSNPDFGGLTPRQYLADKPLSERMRVGRDALVLFGVMKR